MNENEIEDDVEAGTASNEEEVCPDGTHWDPKTQTCVPDNPDGPE